MIDWDSVITAKARAAAELQARRATMRCSRMQGILVLGEARWAAVMAYYETATWAERIIIDSADDWLRTSENIAFFGYLLNLSDAEMDAMFEAAAGVTV